LAKNAIEGFREAWKDFEKGKKAKRTETVDVVLPNAVPGKVVVRFGESRVERMSQRPIAWFRSCFLLKKQSETWSWAKAWAFQTYHV
jgi:hypothetical protein